MSGTSGLNTSEMGVEVFEDGKHPRTLRKEKKQVNSTLESAYKAWLEEQDERTQKLAERDPRRGLAQFQNDFATLSVEDLALRTGVEVGSDVEDESQAANMGSGQSTGEKRESESAMSRSEAKRRQALGDTSVAGMTPNRSETTNKKNK